MRYLDPNEALLKQTYVYIHPILLAEIHVGSAITIPTTHSREAFLHDFFQFRHSPLNSNLLFLLVIIGEDRPEDDGAITSAWDDGEITSVIVNAPPRGTWNDQVNRRTMNLRTDQGNEGTSGSPTS